MMIQFPKPIVDQFFRTYAITNFAVSRDEQRLIFNANLNGKMNLWAMDLPDTFPYLFAQQDQMSSFVQFDPSNRYVLSGFDQDGDENQQIYAVSPDGGLPQPFITGSPQEKYFFAHVSGDGKRVYYMTSEGNASFLNTHVRSVEDGSDQLIHTGKDGLTELSAVSKEEKAFVYLMAFANTYATGFVKTDGQEYCLTPDPEKIHVTFDPIFVDETTVYFATNYESEYSYVAKFDLVTKEFSPVVTLDNESVQGLKFNQGQQALYILAENGVKDNLYRYNLEKDSLEKLKMPVDVISQLYVAQSGSIYALGQGATVPPNIYHTVDGVDGLNWKRLTNNTVLGVSKEEMIEPNVVTYPSFDDMEIEALLFKANPESANGHTIFWPHGGPQAAERKTFRSMFQCFTNRGYNVFAPNFRGSTGYGSSFVKMVEQDWGEGPRLDCVAGIEWLFEKGITDQDKLFLVGGSYGGYMTLLLHGRHPEYFKACIDIFGPSDLFTFVNSVPSHWKPIMERWIGNPERDKERFTRDSPVTYLDTMTKPMLVVQGAKDPRVVRAESDQIVAKLQEKGRDVEYMVLEDEGHGFRKKENEINTYTRMIDFLEKHRG